MRLKQLTLFDGTCKAIYTVRNELGEAAGFSRCTKEYGHSGYCERKVHSKMHVASPKKT